MHNALDKSEIHQIPKINVSNTVKIKFDNLTSVCNNLTSVSSASLPILIAAAQPIKDVFRRSHRHSIPGHRVSNYLKFVNEYSNKGSSTAHLFSTAVISGSSSAPNLKEMPLTGEGHGKSNLNLG